MITDIKLSKDTPSSNPQDKVVRDKTEMLLDVEKAPKTKRRVRSTRLQEVLLMGKNKVY